MPFRWAYVLLTLPLLQIGVVEDAGQPYSADTLSAAWNISYVSASEASLASNPVKGQRAGYRMRTSLSVKASHVLKRARSYKSSVKHLVALWDTSGMTSSEYVEHRSSSD